MGIPPYCRANLPRAQAHEIDQALARLTGIGRTAQRLVERSRWSPGKHVSAGSKLG